MRCTTEKWLAALCGLAAGMSQPAEVFVLRDGVESSSQSRPQIPKEIARQIFLQRASNDVYGHNLHHVPGSIDQETAIQYMSNYGKTTPSLFHNASATPPLQLILLLEGTTDENTKALKEALGRSKKALVFSVPNPPSAMANKHLLDNLVAVGALDPGNCDLVSAVHPVDSSCYKRTVAVAKSIDVHKDVEAIHTLLDNFPRYENYVSAGSMEAVIVLIPESSRASKAVSWASSQVESDLGRRQVDYPISESPNPAPSADSESWLFLNASSFPDQNFKGFIKNMPADACFVSESECASATNNCSGHGQCKSWASSCFKCECTVTVLADGTEEDAIGKKTISWGGAACQKKDVSVPFWLLAGFSVTMIGLVIFMLDMLFSVGEEPLPGVIGAGVSRSK